MSVAYDYLSDSVLPEPWSVPQPRSVPQRPAATVVRLFAPAPARHVRLTRRGVFALAALVATVACALVLLAWLNGPSGAAAQGSTGPVTVRPGDTLWSIAERVAPGTDPRAEVAELRRINGLTGADGVRLVPGQVLRTR
jgi:Tfp pilus assembly protein FimV